MFAADAGIGAAAAFDGHLDQRADAALVEADEGILVVTIGHHGGSTITAATGNCGPL